VKNLDPILAHLERSHARYNAAAQIVPAERWRETPAGGGWSAGEVTAHLMMAEETMAGGMKLLLQKPPVPTPFLKRFHIPLLVSTWRVKKVKSPIPLDANLVSEKTIALEKLSATRSATMKIIESTRGRDYAAYRYPHPFLGSLNIYEWFRMIGYHELRHAKQIREIVETFHV
jgi:DinB superfamily